MIWQDIVNGKWKVMICYTCWIIVVRVNSFISCITFGMTFGIGTESTVDTPQIIIRTRLSVETECFNNKTLAPKHAHIVTGETPFRYTYPFTQRKNIKWWLDNCIQVYNNEVYDASGCSRSSDIRIRASFASNSDSEKKRRKRVNVLHGSENIFFINVERVFVFFGKE